MALDRRRGRATARSPGRRKTERGRRVSGSCSNGEQLEPGVFGLARLRLDRGINLLQVLGLPHHFQGMGILSQELYTAGTSNVTRVHQTRRVTPAREAGFANHVWAVEAIVALL